MLYFLMKCIMIPIVVLIASDLLTNVNYPNMYQPIIIGVTLAVVGFLLEMSVLRQQTFWITNTLDFILSVFMIYVFSYFFAGANVTLGGAAILAVLLTAIEFFIHIWLIRSGKTREVTKI